MTVEGGETNFTGGLTYLAFAAGLGVTWGWGLAKRSRREPCWTCEGYVDFGIYFLTGVAIGMVEILIFLFDSKGETLEWMILASSFYWATTLFSGCLSTILVCLAW